MRAGARLLVSVWAIVLLATASAPAQEATVVGTIANESKAVPPGVTVRSTNLETGGQTVAVSDERGEYRLLKVPPGPYEFQAELAGFATVVMPVVELLVGQNGTVPFTLNVVSASEALTVSNEPVFELNLDGQQITQTSASSSVGQPALSRDAIAEFQIVTSQFEMAQGRSVGIQVQAISKSGTNVPSGSPYGFFRNDALNAAVPVEHLVLPHSDQQVGGTSGGPVVQNKMP